MRPWPHIRSKSLRCSECGMGLSSWSEYHPHAFCVLWKAGIDPWLVVREAALHVRIEESETKR